MKLDPAPNQSVSGFGSKEIMDVIREKLQEIEDQAVSARQHGGAGEAVREWESAREINLVDVSVALQEHVDIAQLAMADPRGLVLMAFRWGYEVAVSKERAGWNL